MSLALVSTILLETSDGHFFIWKIYDSPKQASFDNGIETGKILELQYRYPTPELLQEAVDSGEYPYDRIPEWMKKVLEDKQNND